MDGNVITFKGRLVTKGFRQVHGVDYNETFSSVAMLKSIRILLAIAVYYDYEIWQMDVKTAFLNGKLLEDVYMIQPEGFVDPHCAEKSKEFGFIKNEDEPYVYKKIDKDDCRSQSEYVFCLNGGTVSWKSSKQETVVDSTTEAEYIAASNAAKEAIWIKKFVTELVVVPNIANPVNLYCDNNGAIAQAKEPGSHRRSKHILRRFHLICEIIDIGDVKICRIPIDENFADPLTKPLVQRKHEAHTRSIGIRQMPDWL
ncbi:hypothetical protein CRG98_014389 [Punica granatum]|uniref:Reverse transcriptase Ty1/copia-type domain-containing protein n=1 Tax=Punica granatum TaxID=22663 RepID=A0A2I0KAN3_PUNGR|nr:hypothetical protein CRG98_014389 [Punica granatum]